jgi:hypothetical protein
MYVCDVVRTPRRSLAGFMVETSVEEGGCLLYPLSDLVLSCSVHGVWKAYIT